MNGPRVIRSDAYGLTPREWDSLLTGALWRYSSTALLFWALVGGGGEQGVQAMIRSPLPTLLGSIMRDVQALAALSKTSRKEEVRAMGATLEALSCRLEAAAEMSRREQEEKADDSER